MRGKTLIHGVVVVATVAVAGCGDTEAFSPTREGPGVSWTAQQRGSPRQYQGAEFSPLATTEARTRRRIAEKGAGRKESFSLFWWCFNRV